MAKPHKYAWNGLDAETSLSIETVANMAQRAALESTGDLLKGKQRIVSVKSTDQAIEFRINDFLISFNKLMIFTLSFTERGGRVLASTSIDWYMTSQTTVGGFIPVSSKTMVAHHTFMQFVRNLASQITAADPHARITIREGVRTAGAASPGAAEAPLAAASPTPTPGPSAVLPPPPPPPPARLPEAVRIATPPPPPPPPPPRAPNQERQGGSSEPPPRLTVAGALVTGIPGGAPLPAPAPVSDLSGSFPAAANPIAAQIFAEDEDLESTRIAQAQGHAKPWIIVLDDGREVGIRNGGVVLGRAPSPPASHPGAEPVAVSDPEKSVSKTHAVLAVEGGMLWVTDLHSTNGTRVTNEIGEAMVCPPDVAMPAGSGWSISLGEFTVRARLRT